MSRYVSDTHALHRHLAGNPKLSTMARQIFQVAGMVASGLVESGQGKVRLLRPEELPAG